MPSAQEFILQIARMTKDGEGGFILENDDAVSTLHSLIDIARVITTMPERVS